MASTYSSLKIELIGTGDQSGTWGTTTNINLGTAIEEAITGSADVAFSSADVTLTLTNTNGSQTARNLRLNLTGTSGGARNLTVPDIEKYYIIKNGLADTVTVKNSTGANYGIPAGTTAQVFSTGVGIADALSFFDGAIISPAAVITGGSIDNTPIGSGTKSTGGFTNVTATGTLQVDGNTTLGNASSDTITANAGTINIPNNLIFNGTGSVTLPKGTTAQEPGTPVAGMIRYNSDTDSFEGYTTTFGWGAIGGGNATSTGLWQNIQTIVINETIQSGYNASSVGPITIGTGGSVTVPAGSTWLVL
jgi:hypothetical protein